jgi:hypothetical protein
VRRRPVADVWLGQAGREVPKYELKVPERMYAMSPQNRKPVKDSRAGNVQVSIWCNEIQQDGETRIRHSIHIPGRHRKNNGSCEGTGCGCPEELPQLAAAVQEALEYVVRAGSRDAEEAGPI